MKQHLDVLKTKRVMDFDISHLVQKISTINITTTKHFEELNLDFLFNYNIFPDVILNFKSQWSDEQRLMQTGDTIAQQVYLPPIKIVSQKIIFGVRIKEIFNQENKRGFSYETLEGHVEKGISTFTLEHIDGEIIFKIETHSLPGNFLTRILGPIFSVPYQKFCTQKALRNVKLQLENQ